MIWLPIWKKYPQTFYLTFDLNKIGTQPNDLTLLWIKIFILDIPSPDMEVDAKDKGRSCVNEVMDIWQNHHFLVTKSKFRHPFCFFNIQLDFFLKKSKSIFWPELFTQTSIPFFLFTGAFVFCHLSRDTNHYNSLGHHAYGQIWFSKL